MQYKQALLLRVDLEMGKGKLVSQGAHAALQGYLTALQRKEWREWAEAWLAEGMKKVVLRVHSEGELIHLVNKAKVRGIPTAIIRDAGLTQVPPNSVTAAAVGPAPGNEVDAITGELKLL